MTKVVWRYGRDGKVRPDPPPTDEELFRDDGPHDIEVRQAGCDWEVVGTSRNIYLAMEVVSALPRYHAARVVKRPTA